MATQFVGSIGEFDSAKENFSCYLDRIEQFFTINEVLDKKKKVALFITIMGPSLYGILKSVMAPEEPKNKSFVELVNALKEQLEPKNIIIAERFKFNKRQQKQGESISLYIMDLKKLASSCDYKSFLDDALRDRLVCGLESEHIQKKLLVEENLNFKKACHIALSMELASTQAKLLQPPIEVNEVRQSRQNYFSKNGKRNASCKHCGRDLVHHREQNCPALKWNCYNCGKKGHTSKVCRNPTSKTNQRNKVKSVASNVVESNSEDENSSNDSFQLKSVIEIKSIKSKPAIYTVVLQDRRVTFEVDSGASVTVMSKQMCQQLFPNKQIEKCKKILQSVSGEKLKVCGQVQFKVDKAKLKLILVKDAIRKPLLGRNWLDVIRPNWRNNLMKINKVLAGSSDKVREVNNSDFLDECKVKFSNVFVGNRNPISGFKANIIIKPNVSPIFHKAYDCPLAIKDRVAKELIRLEKEGVIYKVKHSEWASPICVVPKKDAGIRICVDFKKTLNRVVDLEHYPLPKTDELFSKLAGSTVFVKLDLAQAYQQLEVDNKSSEYLTINTHLGLYRFKRLCYGISPAAAIFQSVMDRLLREESNAFAYLDDILIRGDNLTECKNSLLNVLKILNKHNVQVNLAKCEFFRSSIEYLGHMIDKKGLHTTKEKVTAIKKAPTPANVTQLKAWLGLVNFYHKFLPNASSILKPLHRLTEKNIPFKWEKECEEAFLRTKELITKSECLAFFNPKYPILLTCDASSYGVGAVLSILVDGEERPVAFASSTLNKGEIGYAHLEKEALAIVFGVKKFHRFLYGQQFTIISDHQPLKYIFDPNRNVPTLAAARIQRWALLLSAYRYKILYRKGSAIANADALSRLPLRSEINEHVETISLIEEIPLTYESVASATAKDRDLSRVVELTKAGWPNSSPDDVLKIYFGHRNNLSVENGCLLLGFKVVIPSSLREDVLTLLHDGHPGIVRTKMLARSYVWWPLIDQDIENRVSSCVNCQTFQKNISQRENVWWPKTSSVFERVHIDFLEIKKIKFLLLTDHYSKWVEAWVVTSMAAESIIGKLRSCFATFGVPACLVSDNGPPFSSTEFQMFLSSNGIKALKSPPYNPKCNGLAERTVQTFENMIKKELLEKDNRDKISKTLSNVLFKLRNIPSAVTKVCPAEMVFKFRPKSRLSMLKPPIGITYQEQIPKSLRQFSANENVWVKICGSGSKEWHKGTVIKRLSITSYVVQVKDDFKIVHLNQIRSSPTDRKECDITKEGILVEELSEGERVETSEDTHRTTDSKNKVPDNEENLATDVPKSTGVEESSGNAGFSPNIAQDNSHITTRSGRDSKRPERLIHEM